MLSIEPGKITTVAECKAKQGSRFAIDHLEVVFRALDSAAAEFGLEDLSFNQLVDTVESSREGPWAIDSMDEPECPNEKPITGKDGNGVAVHEPRGGLSSALIGEVDHVVVKKRRIVNVFHDRRQP